VSRKAAEPEATPASIVREYGPFSGTNNVRGVTYDGTDVWFAADGRLLSFDPESGVEKRSLPVRCDAGTGFDGEFLYQISEGEILKIEPHTGQVVSRIPAPPGGNSGLTWAEGTLWVGGYKDRVIRQIDPATGKVLRTLESSRFVTGVTFADGELWHATWEGESSDLRHIDQTTGEVLERLEMPEGTFVSGLEFDGNDLFYCGGASTSKVRAVRHPKRR
jgi:outer membrane protein assembly factor BamB